MAGARNPYPATLNTARPEKTRASGTETMDDGLTVEKQPSAADRAILEDNLYAFNVAASRIADGRLLGIFQRDDDGVIVAGLYGWTWGGCLEIELLWVREDRRGAGLGSRLVAAAEAEAIRRGCRQALLDTHSFQAPGFYHRLGYEIYATLDDYPAGHKKHYLRKTLTTTA